MRIIFGFLVLSMGLALVEASTAQPPFDKKGPPPKGKRKGGESEQPSRPDDRASFGNVPESAAPPAPAGMKHIAGRWYVKEGSARVYYFRDAHRFADLFSLTGDSNEDGIPDLMVSHDDAFLILDTQNLPNHPHAPFPNSRNPNTIEPQKMRIKLPLVPKSGDKIARVGMGPIGVAINGVVFFNPFEAGGMNAVAGYNSEWLDSCCGHPQQSGVYHYHKYPSCIKSPFPDDGQQHSPPIGFAFDGYPVYGPYESEGVMAKDLTGEHALDVCNGHFDPERGYHYHATPGKFPYIIGGYAGVPERSNLHGPRGSAVVGAIRDNAKGTSKDDISLRVTPGNLSRGKTHQLRIEFRHDGARIPAGTPYRVIVGPYVAGTPKREGDVVTVEIAIPADANVGVMHDCHLEFRSDRGRVGVVKNNDAVRIVE